LRHSRLITADDSPPLNEIASLFTSDTIENSNVFEHPRA
jgi:hypothetical protein